MVKSVKKTILDYIVLTFAAFIFAVSWECFMIPNGMSAGGLMGLCTIVQYATGGLIEAQFSYVVVNTVLIIIAVMAMGIGFGFKTIYCIALTPVLLQLSSTTQAS